MEFKEGDKAAVINGIGHYFSIGTIVEIRNIQGDDYICFGEDMHQTLYRSNLGDPNKLVTIPKTLR